MRHFVLCLMALFVFAPLHAQWVQTNGPFKGDVNCFALSGMNLFAGTNGDVFLSTNNGSSWICINSGLTNTNVIALTVSGTDLYADM